MDNESDKLTGAVLVFDIAAIRRLAAEGADLNARDQFGDPFLFNALFHTAPYDETAKADGARYEIIPTLLDLGADPHQLAGDGASILIGPIFSQDAKMVELLLMRGVDPNRGCCDPWDTVYEVASTDYDYEAWIKPDPAPAFPDLADTDDEDLYLRRLDEEAQARGMLRPVIPLLLRKHGALSNREMARKLGGSGSERIEWREDGWRLAVPDLTGDVHQH